MKKGSHEPDEIGKAQIEEVKSQYLSEIHKVCGAMTPKTIKKVFKVDDGKTLLYLEDGTVRSMIMENGYWRTDTYPEDERVAKNFNLSEKELLQKFDKSLVGLSPEEVFLKAAKEMAQTKTFDDIIEIIRRYGSKADIGEMVAFVKGLEMSIGQEREVTDLDGTKRIVHHDI